MASKYEGVITMKGLTRTRMGGFSIVPLKVPHGDCPNYAYVIDHKSIGRMVFCTDAETLPYSLSDVNVLAIEANYSKEIILERLCDGHDILSHFDAHMEINETIKIIRRLYNPNLNKVILVHLSDGNSNEQIFKELIFSEIGVRCDIADVGSVHEIKDDF